MSEIDLLKRLRASAYSVDHDCQFEQVLHSIKSVRCGAERSLHSMLSPAPRI